MYQLLLDPMSGQPAHCTRRLADGAIIPHDPMNTDYQEFQRWIAEGGQPLAADPLPVEESAPEEPAP